MRTFRIALPLLVCLAQIAWSHAGFAQTTGGGGGGAGAGNIPGPTGGSLGSPTPGNTYVVVPPTQTPSAPTGPVGGGNVSSSSSKPITGPNDRDGFDLGGKPGGSGTLRGGDTGAIFSHGSRLGGTSLASIHTVRRGDTLWDICDFYFQNPYQWPRIWSYNAQIKNPHWIYPGDTVRLKPNAPETKTTAGFVTKGRVSPNTIFLRNEGYVDDGADAVWGEIVGSREEKMFLDDFDEVYIRVNGDRPVQVGQELTIFRPIRRAAPGNIVELQGTVKVDNWNAKERIARGRITETSDAIERGAFVGPIERKFEVVAPVRNEVDVKTKVIASLSQNDMYGQNHVVFISAGAKQGLKPGNRLFAMRTGDGWIDSLPSKNAATRIAHESDSPAEVERVPGPSSKDTLPPETMAEIRVISVRDNSALCIVTDARRELSPGDAIVARKGY
ncbi:MAG: LysM peptidoglycan-binding domain-containing protein [Polyangiaceae bacterium]